MADRHTILICVKDGNVREVVFCDCCPGVTVEVRTYIDDSTAAAVANSARSVPDTPGPPGEYHRDITGLYRAAYYEPDDVGE